MSLLRVDGLSLRIGCVPILDSVSLALPKGEIYGLAGESGSGKSMTALCLMGLLPPQAQRTGSIRLADQVLSDKNDTQMCAVRGRDIGMVFQEPMSALNPLQPIGRQVAETVRIHTKASMAMAMDMAVAALERVGLPPSEISPSRLPNDLSGGQRQRVAIAMATVLRPKLIIADEPTTALDVTAQARILALLKSMVEAGDMSLLLITHDLAVMAQMADHLAIMKDGKIVETGPTLSLLRGLSHPYAKSLLENAVPRAKAALKPTPSGERKPVLEARGVSRDYPLKRHHFWQKPGSFRAVNAVDLKINQGESVGLVGESGCGKSTLLRTLLALNAPQGGAVLLRGEAFSSVPNKMVKAQRRHIQMVFQDPYGSFNPRHKIERLIAEPFHLEDVKRTADWRRTKVEEVLKQVGLKAADADKYPHQFSGGQRQRIAIARALITNPSIIALDEAVSALDVTVRTQILELLANLLAKLDLSLLFVSHDLSVVRAICDRVYVMQNGKIVEHGNTEDVFLRPAHVYTKALVAATPNLEAALAARENQAV